MGNKERHELRISGRTFVSAMRSDLARDGMSLEIEELVSGKPMIIAEVFYSDENDRMTVSLFAENLPLELVEHMCLEARNRLVPEQKIAGGNL